MHPDPRASNGLEQVLHDVMLQDVQELSKIVHARDFTNLER